MRRILSATSLVVSAALLLPATAAANYAHLVAPGETLTSVAATDGLSIEAIARANGISPNAELIAGQTLWIPPRTAANAATGVAGGQAAAQPPGQATVQPTATPVATGGANTDPDEDADTDRHRGSAQRESAPGTAAAQSTATQSTTAQSPTAQSATTQSDAAAGSAPIPTPEYVTSSQIASVAGTYGVPAALAQAIAWQESGWSNDVVSSVGAVGVMQIVPTTWRWIDSYLTPSNPLGTASASENVRAGVLLLHQLLGLTGGNEPLAVAGYFQGLASVRRFGMFASTQQYVADVMALAQRFAGQPSTSG
jgi:soluble lytic murein transglycosylase-like protein